MGLKLKQRVCCRQNDVSGRCTVQYRATNGQVTRTKLLETCQTSETGFTTHSQVRPYREPPPKRRSWITPLHTTNHQAPWSLNGDPDPWSCLSRCWVCPRKPVLWRRSHWAMVSLSPPRPKRFTYWPPTPADRRALKLSPGKRTVSGCLL